MTRRITATAALVGALALVALYLVQAAPNPYAAPAFIAFGSGAAPTGAFCAALPG